MSELQMLREVVGNLKQALKDVRTERDALRELVIDTYDYLRECFCYCGPFDEPQGPKPNEECCVCSLKRKIAAIHKSALEKGGKDA